MWGDPPFPRSHRSDSFGGSFAVLLWPRPGAQRRLRAAGPRRPLAAIETKKLHAILTDNHAAQLVQHCAVDGIEWEELTNAREFHLFNTFPRRDPAAKRVLALGPLAFNSDEEFAAVFAQLWQLTRERNDRAVGDPGVDAPLAQGRAAAPGDDQPRLACPGHTRRQAPAGLLRLRSKITLVTLSGLRSIRS